MKAENKLRRKTTSCGGLPVRVRADRVEVLLIKQFAHKESWGIPKGHMHEGETQEQCAIREVREEAGVHVELGKQLPNVQTAFRDEDKTVVSWLCTVVGSQEPNHNDPDSEVADARWFLITELPTLHVYQRPLLAAAIDILSGPSGVLTEDGKAG